MTTKLLPRDSEGYLDIRAARAEQDSLLTVSRAIIADADREARELTERDNQRVAANTARFDYLEAAIGIEEDLRKPLGRRTSPDPVPGGVAEIEPDAANGQGVAQLARGRSFKAMFGARTANDRGNWRSEGEFLRAALGRQANPKLEMVNATMTEGIGADGGFLVPPGFIAGLLDASLESEVVRPRALIVPMPHGGAIVPGPDVTTHASGAVSGLIPEWLAEGATGTRQKAKMTKLEMKAKKLAVFAQASAELEDDAPGFPTLLGKLMGDALGFGLDNAFLFGTGAGMPLGVMNSGALVTVSKESSQTADTVTALNLAKMLARLHPASWRTAVWVVSPTVIPELFRMNFAGRTDAGAAIADTAVGANVFTVNADGSFSIFGRPVIVTEKAKPIGDLGDVMLCDFSKYVIGISPRAGLQRAIEPGWAEDLVDFRLLFRVDGQPLWGAPQTPLNGSTTSPFVTLEAR